MGITFRTVPYTLSFQNSGPLSPLAEWMQRTLNTLRRVETQENRKNLALYRAEPWPPGCFFLVSTLDGTLNEKYIFMAINQWSIRIYVAANNSNKLLPFPDKNALRFQPGRIDVWTSYIFENKPRVPNSTSHYSK